MVVVVVLGTGTIGMSSNVEFTTFREKANVWQHTGVLRLCRTQWD